MPACSLLCAILLLFPHCSGGLSRNLAAPETRQKTYSTCDPALFKFRCGPARNKGSDFNTNMWFGHFCLGFWRLRQLGPELSKPVLQLFHLSFARKQLTKRRPIGPIVKSRGCATTRTQNGKSSLLGQATGEHGAAGYQDNPEPMSKFGPDAQFPRPI